jgi:hypothetical protein
MEDKTPTYYPVNKIPKGSPKDIVSRYDAMQALLSSLRAKSTFFSSSSNSSIEQKESMEEDEEDNEFSNIINRKPERDNGKLLQIRISYVLENKRGHPQIAGYVFRQQKNEAEDSSIYRDNESSPRRIVCAYSLSGAKPERSLEEIDGVRCWLPCMDSLEQRAIFDITIHAPRDRDLVLCAGKRLSTSTRMIEQIKLRKLLETNEDADSSFAHPDDDLGHHDATNVLASNLDGKIPYRSTRFFSATRIPAKSVGFFVGSGESYQMPFYRCRGHIHVALDIQDYRRDSQDMTSAPMNHSSDAEMVRLTNMASSMDIDNLHREEDLPAKRRKVSFTSHSRGDTADIDLSKDEDRQTSSPLYEEMVRHSLLGFDLALRFIHKLLGRRYHHESFAIVYIPGLDFDFLAYDGFLFVSAKHLHDQRLVYAETPHHLVCIRGYLYGYLCATLPVSGYIQQYLLHGIVGYLLHLYVRSVFGEDESSFHLLKVVESVVALSKLFPSTIMRPIATVSLPETFEQFLPWSQAYLVLRSIVLLHILETRVGGSEPIRQAIQQLLKAPENHSNRTTVAPSNSEEPSSERTAAAATGPSLYLESSHARTPSHYATALMQQNMATGAMVGDSSPQRDVSSGWQDQLGSMASPELFPQSPTTYHLPIASDYGGDSSIYSPNNALGTPMLSLQRQTSLSIPADIHSDGRPNNNTANLSFPESLTADCVTGESFVDLLRVITGTANDLDDVFLEQFVYRNLNLRGKFDLRLDAKVEGKPRNFHITLDPIYDDAASLQDSNALSSTNHHHAQTAVKVRICETRENRMNEASFSYGGKLSRRGRSHPQQIENELLMHTQALFSRPGRRGGSRKVTLTAGADDQTSILTINRTDQGGALQMPAEIQRRSIAVRLLYHFHHHPKLFDVDVFSANAKSRRTALQCAQDASHPLRYLLADPMMNQLHADFNISAFPDSLLIEQLFLEMDVYDVLRQTRALRALATSPTIVASSSTAASTNASDKSLALQFHAFADCLQGIQPLPPTAMMIAKGEALPDPNAPPVPVHSIFVRVEAAYSLLEWQMNRLPPSSAPHLSSSLLQKDGRWEGALLLMKMLCDVFVDPMTGQLLPVEDDADEWMTYLRGGLITIVSQLKTHRGITPNEVIDFLLLLSRVITNRTTSSFCNDYLHATYLLALSRLTAEASTAEGIKCNEEILSLAKAALRSVFSTARSEIYIAPSSRQRMPSHQSDGMLAAAALTCLGQIDRRAYFSLNADAFVAHCLPSTTGIVSHLDYAQFFLPDVCSLSYVSKKKVGGSFGEADRFVHNANSSLNTPLLRMVALEAFLSICLGAFSALVTATQQQQLQQQLSFASTSTTGTAAAPASKPSNLLRTPDNSFLPMAIEAMLLVVRHDPDLAVRQHAALTWWNMLTDQPPSIAIKGLSLGNFGNSSLMDPSAFSYRDPYLQLLRCRGLSSKVTANAKACLRSVQHGLRKEVKRWWKQIVQFEGHDQTTRSLLLMSWIFVFQEKAPRSLMNLPASASPALTRAAPDANEESASYERVIEQMKIPAPTTIIEPLESYARVEMKLRQGSSFVLPAMRSQQPPAMPPPSSQPAATSAARATHAAPQPKASRPVESTSSSHPPPPSSSKDSQSLEQTRPSTIAPPSNTLQLKLSTKVAQKDPSNYQTTTVTATTTAGSATSSSVPMNEETPAAATLTSPMKLSLKLSLKRSTSESSMKG